MRTYISSLLVALFFATAAHGQLSLEGGINMANLAWKANGDQVKTKFRYMDMFGLIGEIKMSNHIYFDPQVYYKNDGCNITSADTPVIFTTATAALVIEYLSGTKCSSRAMFGAGPFLSFISSATYRNESMTGLKDKNFGLTANVGYRVGKHWYLKISYWMGMTNLIDGGDDKNYIKTSSIGITGGFHMGGCHPHRGGSWSTGSSHHWRGLRNNGQYRKVRNYRHWLGY